MADAAAADTKPDVKPGSEPVTIKVKAPDGSFLSFRVKGKTKFSKIASAYAEKKGYEVGSLLFTFDGERMEYGDKSVADLNLEDGDIVDVTREQLGGASE